MGEYAAEAEDICATEAASITKESVWNFIKDGQETTLLSGGSGDWEEGSRDVGEKAVRFAAQHFYFLCLKRAVAGACVSETQNQLALAPVVDGAGFKEFFGEEEDLGM